MLTQSPPEILSLEEYRNLETSAETKHEYHDGEIIEMTGGSINHNSILINLIVLLKLALRGTNYRLQSSDLRLWIPQYNRGLYPDLMIIAGEPLFSDNRNDEILNPCLIIEVLSPSTSGYDRGDKFRYYRSIPQLNQYLLVSQGEILIESYSKTSENNWLLQEYTPARGIISLDSLGISLNIADIYEGIDFNLNS
ncbi:MAG: Uma2 family endonuclease [Microcystis wesenbergii TW10]|jgi:Uma2 family endonuclease|uniref:Uma2 family endonuclease n=2 Tax=Microcystis wesenbergii TaxID=44823 RepID=A0ABU3HP72_9CHRO|nr:MULTISPECIES: Uma2 family endonuclease [Microcystis]REJ50867.1 MAG: Uma2 family endonuclease [Microcystis wesenbergii TW10]MBD2117179.1 Uma2 family endonuclease [Microcystis wesenbergii FACHB-1339]MCZ8037830.1 Uma2 family endonuclease [Microcystis sp. LE17-20A]MCZ8210343.1 Uma2 family endonuclease [Microcystis sp. LE19-8.1F]MDT3676360.1 Uma2 family endonuclease [Microcystis wesenbergii NRERC-220]